MKHTWLSRSAAAALMCGSVMITSEVVAAGLDYRNLAVDESPTVCVRLRVPMTADRVLGSRWLSRAEIEIASRLRGESCDRGRYAFVDEEKFDYVVRAINVLREALNRRSDMIDSTGIAASTMSCVLRGRQLWVQNGDIGVDEEYRDDPSYVVLDLGGCDRAVEARVAFESPHGPSIALSYKVFAVDVD